MGYKVSSMLYLVIYDLSSDKNRNRLLKVLKGYAISSQKSVYECMLTENQLKEICNISEELIKNPDDRISIIELDPRCSRDFLGKACVQDPNVFIISKEAA